MLSDRRNSVSSNREVGKTLNSTGLVMYIETSSTITEIVMLALISKSSRKGGSGMIIARTMPKTASGMLNSERFPNRDASAGAAPGPGVRCLDAPPRGVSAVPGGPAEVAGMEPIVDGAAISGEEGAGAGPGESGERQD